jgi:hypothetical protein
VARINQDAEISRQVSLWDQHGSKVIQGNLLVIPIEEGLLYVRPLYLHSESGKIPELKRVIVAYENKIAMEETLEGALSRIFGGEIPGANEGAGEVAVAQATAKQSPAAPGGSNLAQQAGEAYERAIEAQRQGDWAKYGEEIRKLGSIIDELRRSAKPAK